MIESKTTDGRKYFFFQNDDFFIDLEKEDNGWSLYFRDKQINREWYYNLEDETE